MTEYLDLLHKVTVLQDLMIARATGAGGDDAEYAVLRKEILGDHSIEPVVPRFVKTCRDLSQFWLFIQPKFPTYAERRKFLWDEFRPALDMAEAGTSPLDEAAGPVLRSLNSETVHRAWRRGLERKVQDPEGAITAARALLESVYKHVLEQCGVSYKADADLNTLYHLASTSMNLAPNQHTAEDFKRILGACTQVVHGLGTLRNRLGDAHGAGPRQVKPAPRHAELAVNLAGALAAFFVATWEARNLAPPTNPEAPK
jgi:hypothetical protein